jgi:hypothetical protein
MKRFFISILASLVVLLSFAEVAQARPLTPGSSTMFAVAQAPEDVIEQLKTNVLPQIQNILTPEQQKQFEAVIVGGASMRKAFKLLTLTPEQKTQLATVLKSISKMELFTAMTPEQKREFFVKKKGFFQPTLEEIAGYKSKQGK